MLPQKGEIWKHYKHDSQGVENNYIYEVVGVSVHTETEELMVCYKPLYISEFLKEKQADFFCRPLSMWNDHVEKHGYSGPRFMRYKN